MASKKYRYYLVFGFIGSFSNIALERVIALFILSTKTILDKMVPKDIFLDQTGHISVRAEIMSVIERILSL